MKAWPLFLPQVHPETYGAPQILEIEAIRNAAIDFCERTKCWQEIQPPYPLATGVTSYQFATDRGVLVHEILGYHLLGGASPLVKPQTTQWCDENYPGWPDGVQVGKPTNVTQLDPDSFWPIPAPSGGPWSAVLQVCYKPTRDSTQGPDLLFNDYYEVIALGAKARLMAMPGQVWANPQLAVAYGALFDSATEKANVRVAKAFGRGRIRVKANFI